MDEHVDVVVVGSGFGASVAAYRCAGHGLSVRVLERGRAYPPGSFARRPNEMAANVWDPARGLRGLFDLWSFRGIDVLVSAGLGGGSLIYANVLLRKDERWFVQDQPFGGGYEHWPISRADLDPHYDRVEAMLRPQTVPLGLPGYPAAAKTGALREAAKSLGLEWHLAPLAVTFANAGREPVPSEPIPQYEFPDLHGLPRRTCRLCGECDLGCNDGAKNSLDHTYLSAAKHAGADIRPLSEVRSIEPRAGGGFAVGYVVHGAEATGSKGGPRRQDLLVVTCDRLVVGAGTLGSTGLLLRNRSALPHLAPALGTRFSGNGDLLTFAMNCKSGQGRRGEPLKIDGSHGPVITSYVRVPDEVDGGTGRGYYIEDAGYPTLVDWLVEASQAPSVVRRALRIARRRATALMTRRARSGMNSDLAELIGSATLSSTSLPFLGMGRDVPDGVMRLRRGELDIDWTMATSRAYFDRVRGTMAALAGAMGGTLHDNPLWWLKRVVSVHPLGGVPMGRHEREGVVDQWGEAFNYPGLYVLDGSVMPGAVGANPSLTIAAFADRACDHFLAQAVPRATRVPLPTPAAAAGPVARSSAGATTPADISLSFTEEMKGFVSIGEVDFRSGFETGREQGTSFMFHLTITATDVDRFLRDRTHLGRTVGWVESDLFGGRLPVTQGDFNLFVEDAGPGVKHMYYRLFFDDGAGHPLTMTGVKDVHDGPDLDIWPDTSTLYVRILRGHVPQDGDQGAEVVASGILRILIVDFARQLTTFRVHGGESPLDRAHALAKFGASFVGDLWDAFGGRADNDLEAR